MQGTCIFILLLALLTVDNILDLSGPVDHHGFQPLSQVFVFGTSFQVGYVFIGDVQDGLIVLLFEAELSDGQHELVELADEVFAYGLWPGLRLDCELRDVVVVHGLQQVV